MPLHMCPQGVLASTLSSKVTGANYYRLSVVARAGERKSRARSATAYVVQVE